MSTYSIIMKCVYLKSTCTLLCRKACAVYCSQESNLQSLCSHIVDVIEKLFCALYLSIVCLLLPLSFLSSIFTCPSYFSAAIVMLFTQLRNKKTSKEALILSEEDIRENVVTYDDEGGGEEDTEAFDIAALRNPKASEHRRKFQTYLGHEPTPYGEEDEDEGNEGGIVVVRRKKARDVDYGNYSPESEPGWFVIDCIPREINQSGPSLLLDGHDIIQQIIQQKVAEADSDTRGPPYDSLQTYAYEGCGSLAGSVSSLGLTVALPELNYADFENWEPERQTLERNVREQLTKGQTNPDT